MKKKYYSTLSEDIQLWRYEEDPSALYVDFHLHFIAPLSSAEKNEALLFIFANIKERTAFEYCSIQSVNFAEDDLLKITFQHINLGTNRLLYGIIADFLREFSANIAASSLLE